MYRGKTTCSLCMHLKKNSGVKFCATATLFLVTDITVIKLCFQIYTHWTPFWKRTVLTWMESQNREEKEEPIRIRLVYFFYDNFLSVGERETIDVYSFSGLARELPL